MNPIWYAFLDEYHREIPYKPLSVILEAFWWYVQKHNTSDHIYEMNAENKVNDLMAKI